MQVRLLGRMSDLVVDCKRHCSVCRESLAWCVSKTINRYSVWDTVSSIAAMFDCKHRMKNGLTPCGIILPSSSCGEISCIAVYCCGEWETVDKYRFVLLERLCIESATIIVVELVMLLKNKSPGSLSCRLRGSVL